MPYIPEPDDNNRYRLIWCYICEVYVPNADIEGHDINLHCAKGQHCTVQTPECGVDQHPGADHYPPYRCCACKEMVK